VRVPESWVSMRDFELACGSQASVLPTTRTATRSSNYSQARLCRDNALVLVEGHPWCNRRQHPDRPLSGRAAGLTPWSHFWIVAKHTASGALHSAAQPGWSSGSSKPKAIVEVTCTNCGKFLALVILPGRNMRSQSGLDRIWKWSAH